MKSFVVRLEKQRSDEVFFSCLQKTGIDDSNDMYNNNKTNNNNGPSGGGQ